MYDAARKKADVIIEAVKNREKHIEGMGFAGKLFGFAYGPSSNILQNPTKNSQSLQTAVNAESALKYVPQTTL
jgi:hypothetical protein